MPIIRANRGIVTQINVFTVPDGQQQPLIDALSEAAQFASTTPGWLSASLHRSRDGTRVVNYAQTESAEAARSVIERLREAGFLDRNKAFGEADPGLYDVVATFERLGCLRRRSRAASFSGVEDGMPSLYTLRARLF